MPPRLRDAADPDVPPQLDAPGRVVLELRVEPDGHVSDATVLESTHAFLEEPARVAAHALVFEPATDDGVPIPALIAFAFDFAPPPPPPPPPPPAPEPAPTPPAAADDEIASIDVEVHAERAPLEPTRHSLDAAEVRRVPGTNGDAIRAIESLPGVARPPGLDGSIIVRGSAPQDTQVFVDGALIPLAYHFGGVSSVVPSEILDRLELRPGNFGSEYGRGMGG
ncbi:MAG: TonB family protein, partial [Myxococcales bacterium]|nr:TonB family protein [Myxococcales bacterium]